VNHRPGNEHSGAVTGSTRATPAGESPHALTPTVSVVITTIGRQGLSRAVRSALAQTLPPREVLVVYDPRFPEPKVRAPASAVPVRVIRSDGEGVNASRNSGVRRSVGVLIALMDDDDYWFVDKLAAQVGQFEKDPTADVVTCLAYDEYRHRPLPRRNYAGEGISDVAEYLFCRPLRHPAFDAQIRASSLMVRRPLILEVPFKEDLDVHQDWDWLLRVAARPDTSIDMVDRPLYHFSAGRGPRASTTPRILEEQSWALNALPRGSTALFGYFWTISLARAVEARNSTMARTAMVRSFRYGRVHWGSLWSGLLYAFAIAVRQRLVGIRAVMRRRPGTAS
jgi:glycosyltransferase involved in cell wall biosynthesis